MSNNDNHWYIKMWENFINHLDTKTMDEVDTGDIMYLETISKQTRTNILETKYRPIIMIYGDDLDDPYNLASYLIPKPSDDLLYGIPLTTSHNSSKPLNKYDLKLTDDLAIPYYDHKGYKVPQGKTSYIRGTQIFQFSPQDMKQFAESPGYYLNNQRYMGSIDPQTLNNITWELQDKLQSAIHDIGKKNPYITQTNRIAMHPNNTVLHIQINNPSDNPRQGLPDHATNEPGLNHNPSSTHPTDTGPSI